MYVKKDNFVLKRLTLEYSHSWSLRSASSELSDAFSVSMVNVSAALKASEMFQY